MRSLLDQVESFALRQAQGDPERSRGVGAPVVAVVGLAKNCGKTTVLNHLVAAYRQAGISLGLTSIGRDGEDVDAITRLPKPSIHIPAGTLAVTAEGSIAASNARLRVVERTGLPSALGELLLVCAEEEGAIELSGPSTAEQAKRVAALLQSAGAARVLIDGALDRRASGAPSVCGAVVLSAGAALGATVESVAAQVAHQVALFQLPEVAGRYADAVRCAAQDSGERAAAIGRDGTPIELPESALRSGGSLAALLADDVVALWAGGAVTDETIEQLLTRRARPEIVAADATRIFISRMSLSRWRAAGGSIAVLVRVPLAAVTTNPFNPAGRGLDASHLAVAVAEVVSGLPVYDVVAGIAHCHADNLRQAQVGR